jgi:hypothetical protein
MISLDAKCVKYGRTAFDILQGSKIRRLAGSLAYGTHNVSRPKDGPAYGSSKISSR